MCSVKVRREVRELSRVMLRPHMVQEPPLVVKMDMSSTLRSKVRGISRSDTARTTKLVARTDGGQWRDEADDFRRQNITISIGWIGLSWEVLHKVFDKERGGHVDVFKDTEHIVLVATDIHPGICSLS